MSEPTEDTLMRDPIAVNDDTDPTDLALEMEARLSALLASHNGLAPDAEGWRDLALALAMEYHPAFRIETPVDRVGRSGIGGRPGGWSTFVLRSKMKAEMGKGLTKAAAAKVVSRNLGIAVGTAKNAFTRKSQAPDSLRRMKYEIKALGAIKRAATNLSQE